MILIDTDEQSQQAVSCVFPFLSKWPCLEIQMMTSVYYIYWKATRRCVQNTGAELKQLGIALGNFFTWLNIFKWSLMEFIPSMYQELITFMELSSCNFWIPNINKRTSLNMELWIKTGIHLNYVSARQNKALARSSSRNHKSLQQYIFIKAVS